MQVPVLVGEIIGECHPEVRVGVADLHHDDAAVRQRVVPHDLGGRGPLFNPERADRGPEPAGQERWHREFGDRAAVEREGGPEQPVEILALHRHDTHRDFDAAGPQLPTVEDLDAEA